MTHRPLCRLIALASVLSLAGCQGFWDGAAPTPSHKVQLPASAALPQGARLVADYGAFRLAEVDDAALSALSARTDVEPRDDYDQILLNAGVLHTRLSTEAAPTGRGLHLVQFKGPIRPEWRAALDATGVRVVGYVPSNSYLVYGEASALAGLDAASGVQFKGAYLARYKLEPTLKRQGPEGVAIQLVDDAPANEATLALIRAAASQEPRVQTALGFLNVVAKVAPDRLPAIAERPDVVSIHARPRFKLLDERQDMILAGQLTGNAPTGPGYLAWLTARGFTQAQFDASGFGVDVTDSPLDNGTTTPNHFGLHAQGDITGASRVLYVRLEGTANPGSNIKGCDGHGNLNAHVIGGWDDHSGGFPFRDAAGFRYGLGVAPFVRLGNSAIFDPVNFTSPDYETLISHAYRDAMRISSNSWGGQGDYDSDAQRYDALVRDAQPAGSAVPVAGNQEMVIVFAAGNDGPSTGTVGSPGTGKNVFTIGASEGVQGFGQASGCPSDGDSEADSASDVASFSSRGPTGDGRKKPDIMAPGSHISGGVAQDPAQAASPPAYPNGKAISCFTAEGVCGLADGTHYWPKGQEWYTTSTGTSHSTPAVAGATALLRQHFLNRGHPVPSPAMTKAWLMGSARYMTGSGGGDNLPSSNQGMGRLDLSVALDDTARLFDDQSAASLFTATGQTRVYTGTIADSARPFSVTLAWTDAPGSTTGSAWNNNLDLTVDVGGKSYKGNVFSGAFSVTGGAADAKNNVEAVALPAGTTGTFTATVTAANINSDGVPGNSTALDQDFALVIYNVCQTAPATPVGAAATAVGNNRIDVSWTANGAQEYRVYRATTAGGPYVRVATVTAPPWSDTTVSGGMTYYYVVRGKDCAESASSAEVSATAAGACLLVPQFAGLAAAQGALVDTCTNHLSWIAATPQCGGALTYSVYRATSSGFSPSAANLVAAGLTATTWDDTIDLVSGTTYFYVVRAVEAAGATVEEQNTVEKSATADGPLQSGTSYLDDFDSNRPPSASSYWSTSGTANLANIVACRYQSSTHAYRLGPAGTTCGTQYPANANATLAVGGASGFAIGAQAAGPVLSFNVWYDFEDGYDGVYLAYSTTAATGPWTAVGDSPSATAPYIASGGYDGTLSMGTVRNWTGTTTEANGALKAVSVNLDALKGSSAWFAFRFTSDPYVFGQGFFVDDVRFDAPSYATCVSEPPGPAVSYALSGLPASVGAGAQASFGLRAVDANGHLDTSYSGTALVTSSDASATLSSPLAFSGGKASGQATFATLGAQTLTATDSVKASINANGSTTVVAGAPGSLQFVQQPASAMAGAAIPVQVKVVDAYGNATNVPAVTLALANNPGQATLSGTLSAATVAGVATFSVSLNKAAVGYTLAASTSGLSATSAPFDISAGAAAKLAFTVQPSTTAAGAPIAPAPAVAIQDALGNQIGGGAQVTLTINQGPAGAALTGDLTVAATAGLASFSNAGLDKVGANYQLKASSNGLADAISATFSVVSGPGYRVHFVVQPTNVAANVPIAPAVQAAIVDAFGNLATSATNPVAVALGKNPGSGTLAGTLTAAAVAGVASFADLSVDRAGAGYTLTVSVAGLSGSDESATFDVAAAPAALLVFTVQPQSAVAGTSLGGVRLQARDATGKVLSSLVGDVTLSLAPAAVTLDGTRVQPLGGGEATFSDLSVKKAGQGYTLVASAPGLAGATSDPFAVTSGGIAAFDVELPASVTVDATVTYSATAVDAFGNTVDSYTRQVTIRSSDPAATLGGAAWFAAGALRDQPITFRTPGTESLTVADVLDPSLRGQAQTTVSAFAQPTIAVTSPADGAKVTGSVSITASGAVAAGTTVKEIAILVDGVALAKGTSATLTAAWNTSALAAGSAHTLTATLSDNAGGATTSTAVKVTIGNPIVAKQGCGCGTSDAGPIAPTLAFFLLAAVGARRRRS